MIINRREIFGFPGYAVSDDGFVWSCWQCCSRIMTDKWHQLRGRVVRGGYLQVALYRDGKPTFRYVHNLVLEAFVGPRPKGMEACHAPDNDRTNNAINNLRWGTPKSNGEDKVKHGTSARGERSGKARLTEKMVIRARALLKTGRTLRGVADEIGVSKSCISEMKRGSTWAWFKEGVDV